MDWLEIWSPSQLFQQSRGSHGVYLTMTSENPNEADDTKVVIGPREQIFHLLAEASEIEHTLMCSYLYAAFSLRSPDAPGFTRAEADAMRRWRRSMLDVATEEMSHL
jgi:hypothetical protein